VLAPHLHKPPTTPLEARAAEVGETDWSLVERMVLLRTIDSLWVEHLTELDDMRRGIGLRGYAQQDPLNEFRREAFRLYEELRGLIRHQVAASIFRVTVTRTPAQPPIGVAASATGAAARVGGAAARRGAAGAVGAGASALGARATLGGAPLAGASGVRPGFTPSGERIGRNDPCYCGSGQKYKKCHGR
jgi:preprotein translocase subunit SecA